MISDLNSNIPVIVEPGGFQSILSGTGKDYGKIKLGSNIVILAVIAGVVASNIRGKSKQGKMILQAACDAWNAEYDEKIGLFVSIFGSDIEMK